MRTVVRSRVEYERKNKDVRTIIITREGIKMRTREQYRREHHNILSYVYKILVRDD